MKFDHGFCFFENEDLITFFDEGLHQLRRKRKGSSYFQDGNFFPESQLREDIPGDGVTDSTCDNPQNRTLPIILNEIEISHRVEFFRDLLELEVELFMKSEPIPGRGAPSLWVTGEAGFPFHFEDGIEGDGLLGMGNPQYGSQDDRDLIFFGKGKGDRQYLLSFFRTGGIEDRNLRKHRHKAGVLFSLRRKRPGIIATDDHKTTYCSDIGGTHQRIRRDIESNLFHGHSRPFPSVGGHQGIFKGNLFIGGPLDIDIEVIFLFEADHCRKDLRAGSPRIGCKKLTSALHEPPGNCFVSK